MTPTPQTTVGGVTPPAVDEAYGQKVVISGIAGLYPQARFIKDLENILYNKVNPVSSDDLRWKYNHPEVAQYTGNVPDLDKFDAQFFKVHYRLGNSMDSMSRKMLEQAFEAIYDAGVSPAHLSGKKVGVYVGTCFSETEKAVFYVANKKNGLGIAGCSKSMFANRISYWLNAKGPSVSIDEACCSSTAALEQAYKDISRGECEAAIVAGANLCLHPQSSVHYSRIMNISMDGKTKSFAEDAGGCAKSEAINVLFLQKAKHAKRIYAEVVNVKCEFVSILDGETGPRYGFYRNPDDTANFLKAFYEETGVAPGSVEYVEAMGSAVPEADKSELQAIDKVFHDDRKVPLLIGSVMSNIGYGEAASGISAITKVLLGYHKGELAGNLHCENPRRDVAALQEGRMRIVTVNQRFQRTYAAVNSMSVTGVNAHVLLYGHYKPKDLNRYKSNIPRLVTVSGRQRSSVQKVFDYLKSHPIDPEELALLHNIHETNIAGHLGKGFIILDTDEEQNTVCLSERATYFDDAARPLWFVYSGMGSQWAGMGAQLMRIPIFAAAIERCRKALEPKGIDIVHIITSSDPSIFDNILHSFVGIAAIQIGLTDVLLELGLVPDKIIGHSVGELGCAYADGCLTAEEMILSAYSRGLVSLETPFIRGSMAAVGMGYQQMLKLCPPEIQIACHNSSESCTISGPAEEMKTFVADLTAQNIFAKEVPCSNIAYHSRYIAKAGPGLQKYLKDVIKTPRARSERWVSTSVPASGWNEPAAKYSSAEYHTNNLLSPVLFEETSILIPRNAVLVEVAPHGLLQAILRRSLPTVTHVPLTRRGHGNSVLFFLEAIGKLFMEGYKPKVRVLYPTVEFPVSTGTPFLSHFVDWAHEEKWTLALYQSAHRTRTASRTLLLTIHDEDYCFLKGHVIRNKIVVPFSFVLVAVWDTLAMSLNLPKKSMSVQFLQVEFFAQPIMNNQRVVKLSVSLHRVNGRFEVMNEDSRVATGFITCMEKLNTKDSKDTLDTSATIQNDYELSTRDVYQLLSLREYASSGPFRSIHSVNISMSNANVLWNNNWVTFIEGLFQLNMLKYTHHGVCIPERVGRILIDIDEHQNSLKNNMCTGNDDTVTLTVHLSEVLEKTRCGGILIENIRFRNLMQIYENQIHLLTLKFFPRFHSNVDISSSLKVLLQIVAENITKEHINVIGLVHDNEFGQIFEEIEDVANNNCLPGIKIHYQRIPINIAIDENRNAFNNADVVLVHDLRRYEKICAAFHRCVLDGTFIINEAEITNEADYLSPHKMYKIVSVLKNKKTQLELAYWRPVSPDTQISAFSVNSISDIPLLTEMRNKMSSKDSLVVLTSYPPIGELRYLVQQWRKDLSNNRIQLIMINNSSKIRFNSNQLLDVNLAFNIFDNGLWGGEYYFPTETNTKHNKYNEESNTTTLQVETIGNIDSAHWVQIPKPKTAGISVMVHYAGINIGDVKRALGDVTIRNDLRKNGFGMEFSGMTESGERVMGLICNAAASTHVVAQPELMWPVPSHWSLEDAATVPFAYVYAYYCLVFKATARISTKNVTQRSVLVHGGAGALGQAAISVALARGYRVFTTVADASKKRFLLRLFPELNAADIGNSRDSCFADIVLSATNGEGCKVVICCLKGELKNASLKCCAPSSTVIDTVQIQNNESYTFGMYNLTNERSYVAADITSILDPKSTEFHEIREMISEGISLGHVRPLSRVVFPPHEAARAFRLLAASRHRGRVLLRMRDTVPVAKPSFISEAGSCHIVVCDSSPLGLQLADKLVECGVKKLHLHFDTALSHLQYYMQRVWKNNNIHVEITIGNLDDISDVTRLLKVASRLGPIEGLHIKTNNILYKNIVKNFSTASRLVCQYLKLFMVLSNSHCSGYLNSIQRAEDEVPIVLLDLSILEKFQDDDGVTWYSGATKAIELALKSNHTSLLAQRKTAPQLTLAQQIGALSGLSIGDETSIISTSLEKLGIPLEKTSSICVFLRDTYNISLKEEDIPLLTVEKLKKLEEMVTDRHYEEVKGIGAFFSHVDPDELLATTEMVFLPTLTNSSAMRDDEFDVNQTYMCIVPGLEGHHARFRSLCERLKLPALVLQPGLDHPDETPKELATRYSKILLKKTGLEQTFYILGYETGVAVALELTSILEDHGLTGTVYCLGAGPDEMHSLLEKELSPYESEPALQECVARHMFSLMARAQAAEAAERALRGCGSWRERVDACVRSLLGRVPHSAQYARAQLEAAYARLGTQRRYNAEPRALRSQVVLLRASDVSRWGAECSLQRYSPRPLRVHELAAPLAHAAADLQVPAIINQYLDDKILQDFEERNLCDSYLMNADAFLTVTK